MGEGISDGVSRQGSVWPSRTQAVGRLTGLPLLLLGFPRSMIDARHRLSLWVPICARLAPLALMAHSFKQHIATSPCLGALLWLFDVHIPDLFGLFFSNNSPVV